MTSSRDLIILERRFVNALAATSDEAITTRLIFGRAILGAGTSTIAGVALMQVPALPLPALVGIVLILF